MMFEAFTADLEARIAVAIENQDWPEYFALKEELQAYARAYRMYSEET